ncbi:sucrase ferredoxin [Saccharomonospora sp. NB11]|jgi:hypothetical protein|uniref:sucrase ferredoxin n=1 Tax=Saccharomonospora sp. NB11 TaxID=1642298 RepID=UPI0018D051D4|nr:sucrase ferredoxin [Saccharomonospora sp. NB11]
MPDLPFRCRHRSEELHESLYGTASTVTRWVLLEEPGPWGPDALRDNRLDRRVLSRLREVTRPLRIRVVFVRRVHRRGGASRERRRCLLAWTGRGGGWVEEAVLDRLDQVLDLDFAALARGRSPGLREVTHPLYLVCTHGAHDPCCAERGRPVARALAHERAAQTWEVSHIGGDRFAANVLVLPDGLYYGRVPPEDVVRLARTHERGEIDVPHLRGRASYAFGVQAAECLLRERTGLRGLDDVPLLSARREGDETEAVFAAPEGGSYRVRVRSRPASVERALTCRVGRSSAPPEHELVAVRFEPD